MGLLTDPAGLKGRQIIIKNHGIICSLLYLVSVSWFCLLASDQINTATYLSENALLPGLVVLNSDTVTDSVIKDYVKELEVVLKETDRIPSAWIRGKFSNMAIESYVHNFSLNYPLGAGQVYEGKNIYGIIRGGGSSTEAIVLSVPFRGLNSAHPSTTPSLALLLALAEYFREKVYWAKDLIMLVTEHEQLGIQAWLEAYHGVTCGTKGVLNAGELPARGGAIQAAINLELHSTRIEYVDIKILGLNGQLPNLDLEKIHNLPPAEQFLHSFNTMVSMVLGQATGVPDGNHGLFHRFGIEAVTIEGHEARGSVRYGSLFLIGRVIEGVFRSVNNLLERFHQSYFFYLLTDTDRFVSIGFYMPCIGMLVGALLIRAFSIHVSLRAQMDDSPDSKNDYNSGGVFLTLLLCGFLGFIAFETPVVASKYLPSVMGPDLRTEESILNGFLGVSLLGIVLIEIHVRLMGEREWSLLNIAMLVHLGTLLLAVSMCNFSLAFLSSIIIVPMGLLVGAKKLPRFFKLLICLICHPLVMTTWVVALSGYWHFGDFRKTMPALKESLVLTSVDTLVYGSSSQVIPVLAYSPAWHMAYALCRAASVSPKVKKD